MSCEHNYFSKLTVHRQEADGRNMQMYFDDRILSYGERGVGGGGSFFTVSTDQWAIFFPSVASEKKNKAIHKRASARASVKTKITMAYINQLKISK